MYQRPQQASILLVVLFVLTAASGASASEASIRKAIAKFDKQIAKIDKQISQLQAKRNVLQRKRNVLQRKPTGREFNPFTDSEAGRALLGAMQRTAALQPSMAKYRKLKIGMTVAQSQAAIGQPGVEASRTKTNLGTLVTHRWSAGIPAAIFATYVDDKLVSKSQYGLE